MAEKIGEAYVRIVYSGEGAHLSKDIRDDLERDAPAFEAIGEEHSKAYDKGFKKEIKKDADVSMETLRKALDKGTGKMEATGGKASSALMDGLEADLKDKFGDETAKVMANSLRDRLKRGGSFEEVQQELSSSLEALVRDATVKLQAGEKKTMDRQVKFEKDFRSSLDKIEVDAKRAWTEGAKAVEEYGFSLDKLRITNGKTNHDFDVLAKSIRDASKPFSFFSRASKSSSASVKKDASEVEGAFKKIDHSISDVADGIGAAFGRGSRNNFLNFFGSLIRNGLQLARVPFKILGGFSALKDSFSEMQKTGGESFRSLEGEGTSFTEILAALAVEGPIALALIAAAAGVLFFTLGPIIAAISLLLGIVTALAAAIAGALIGAIAALASVVAPLGLGLLATVAAFASMKKATGPVRKELDQLKNTFKDLGKEAAAPLFAQLPRQLGILHGIVKDLGPLMHAAGLGMREFFDAILKGMQSSGFKDFETAFTKFLPGALHTLGDIFSHSFNALLGIFRSLIPLAREFLGWLDKVVTKFDHWTNSKSGQESMKKFWHQVTNDAKSVGDLLKSLGDLIAAVFFPARKTGDNIIESLAKNIEKFAQFLATPQGQKQLHTWFHDAKQLANAIGEAVVQIGKLFAAFDDPATRTVALAFFFGLADVIRRISQFVENVITGVHNLGRILGSLGNFDFSKLIPDFSTLHGFNVGQLIKLPNIPALAAHFAGLGGQILKKIGTVNVSGIIRGASVALGSLLGTFAGAAGKVLNKISPVNVAGIIVGAASALSKLLGTFAGTAGKILNKVSPVNVSGIFTGAAAAVSNLLGAFAGLGGRILSEIGHIDIGSLMHGSIDPPGPLGPWSWAAGGIADHEMIRRIGEDGAEAVVPLNRPLSQVDPSVRWLSAIAQNKAIPEMANGGVMGNGRTVNVGGITVISPQADPHAVAVEAINHLVAVGY